MSDNKVGLYVCSYKRSDSTTTFKVLPSVTYVTRKTEEPLYKAAGVPKVWGIEDSLINSFSKVNNYVIENAPEDLICLLDDDIVEFKYRIGLGIMETITNPEDVEWEIESILNIMNDLGIGYGGITQTLVPWNYTQEFVFSGWTGPIRFVNRRAVKSRFPEMKFFPDIDFSLNELMVNRIIFRTNYFCAAAGIETNGGGNNTTRTQAQRVRAYNEVMKPKWGKYFVYDETTNIPNVRVKR